MRSLLLTLALLAAACSSSSETRLAPPATQRRPPAEVPEPRTEVAGTAWRGDVVVAGGLRADGSTSARVDRYDAERNEWVPLPALPEPLHHTALAVVRDRLFVVGGYGGTMPWRAVRAVRSLGAGEPAWRDEVPLPEPRAAHAAVTVGDRLMVLGGVGSGGPTGATAVLTEGTWEAGPSLLQAREHLAAASDGTRVWAIAGRTGGLETNLASVEVLDGGAWRPAPALRMARSGIAAAVVRGAPVVVGGEGPGGTVATVERLEGGRWTEVARIRPRHGVAAAVRGTSLHVLAGGPEPALTVSGDHQVVDLGSRD